MSTLARTGAGAADTHEVVNQPPPLVGYNVFAADAALVEGVRRERGGWAEEQLRELGGLAGGEEAIRWGMDANAHPPVLRTHDRYGHRIDEVEFHPAWHHLMATAIRWGLHASPWRQPRPGAHVARAAGVYVLGQVDAGPFCPVGMTYAAVPALRVHPELAAEWEPAFTSLTYDPGLRPVSAKRGALCGMAMTEKQGGSDVRVNTTRAEPAGAGSTSEYILTGHKWFCSAPMCDAFLVLAQAPRGLSCFLLPRVLPDATRNRFHIQRLKDKLGNRANASSEIELDRAWAVMVGEEGRGVPTIVEMVNYTRLDCVIGSAGLMRQAVAQAAHHAAHRSAFGRKLVDQPLMGSVLADLALEAEAATALMLRLARAYDEAPRDAHERSFARIATAVAKYWVCKRAPVVVGEALECLGGNGYVEESIMPRLYREAPLNSIWEGSGNVICLDVLRAMVREPEAVAALTDEITRAAGADRRFDDFVGRLRADLADRGATEARARRLTERLALALQGSLLLRSGAPAVAEAFCRARLDGDHGLAFGTLPPDVDTRRIIERARPQL